MKMRFLITAIGGDVGSSVVRCLNKEFSKENLVGCDIIPYVSAYDEVGEFFLAPPYVNEEKYLDVLLNECKVRKISYILPMTEGEILIFDKYKGLFNLRGIKVMINKSDILKIAFSKYSTANAVRKMGLNSPKTWRLKENIGEIRYPVIVKPDRGCSSRDVTVVYNCQECELVASKIPDAIIQEYIGSSENEFTVGVFSNGNDIKTIAFRRTLGLGGMSKMVERIEDEKIDTMASTVAKAFQLEGAINLQMRKQEGEYYIFEINPRISSTVGFRYMLGFKDVKWWLDLLDGNKEKIPYIPEKLPVIGIRTLDEKIFRGESLPEGGKIVFYNSLCEFGMPGWLVDVPAQLKCVV